MIELRPVVRRECQVFFDLHSDHLLAPCPRRYELSWAAAHLADEDVSGNTMLAAPLQGVLQINRVGQFPHGLIGCLTESRPAQHVNHMLPAVLHGNHPPHRRTAVPGAWRFTLWFSLPAVAFRAPFVAIRRYRTSFQMILDQRWFNSHTFDPGSFRIEAG
jgi:hypothetical protein